MSVACYCRVSTEDQNLERQIDATTTHATERLGYDVGKVQVYRDKSTGTDTDRSGYQELMNSVEDGQVDAVVVKSVSRVARSIRDLDRTVERLGSHGVSLHLIDEGLEMRPGEDDPFQRAMFQLLGVFAELEANITQNRVKEGIAMRQKDDDYHHGPAPLGFNKDDGYLVEAGNFDRVRTALELIRDDELSKRQAAKELDTSRRTINRSLERRELYGL